MTTFESVRKFMETFGQEIKEKADKTLALGRLTWPHQMVKMMVAEQIYRIDTILKGHPYHK